MSITLGTFPVLAYGNEVGAVTVSQDGLMTAIECLCHYASPDVMRLYAVSGTDTTAIGVPAPEGGNLILKKRFSRNALADMGLAGAPEYHLLGADETPPSFSAPDYSRSAAGEPEPPIVPIAPAEPIDLEPDPEFDGPAIEVSPEPYDSQPDPVDALVRPVAIEPPPVVLTEPIPSAQPGVPAAFTQERVPKMPPAPQGRIFPGNISHRGAPQKSPPNSGSDPGVNVIASQVKLPPAGWRDIQNPSELFFDREIADICRGIRGALTSLQGGVTLLAVPVDAREPFPMMPVFCFGHSQELGGKEYVVFKIKNGNLML